MKVKVGSKTVTLRVWKGGDTKRVYLAASPAIGNGGDWGYVDTDGIHDSRKGGFTNYRYEQERDPQGFAAMIEAAKDLLKAA